MPLLAQEGGRLLTFGLSQSLSYSDNADLDTDPEGDTLRADTALSAIFSSTTRLQSLDLRANTAYRLVEGPGDTDEAEFSDPTLRLGYDRRGANSAFGLDARYASEDIEFLRGLDDFVDEEGNLDLPEDFGDLEGQGTRRSLRAGADLSLGQEGPFGTDFALSVEDVSYEDTTDPDLNDTQRLDADVDLRLALSRVLDARLGFGYKRIDEDGEELRQTRRIETGLSYDRPLGDYRGSLFYEDTEDGDRIGVSAGRDLDLPRGGLSFSLGATRDTEGELALTGDLSLSREFADAALSLSGNRSVSSTDDGEEVRTVFSARYERPLTALAALSLDARYANQENTGTDETTRNASLGASLGYSLTRDWSLDLGYRYRYRDEDGEGTATENNVSLSVGRSFSFRP